MSASPNDFTKVMEENKKLAARNRELLAENQQLKEELARLAIIKTTTEDTESTGE